MLEAQKEEKHCDIYNNERECCGVIIHHLGRMASYCFDAPTHCNLPAFMRAEGTRTKDELRYDFSSHIKPVLGDSQPLPKLSYTNLYKLVAILITIYAS